MNKEALRVVTSSVSGDWATPPEFFRRADERWGPFTLDAAASPENAKVTRFFTKEDDGIKQSWTGVVWVNPPYGRSVGEWVAKAAYQVDLGNARRVVMLLPARTDTRWFHDIVLPFATQVVFVRGRIKFEGADGPAPFPSLLAVFDSSNIDDIVVSGVIAA